LDVGDLVDGSPQVSKFTRQCTTFLPSGITGGFGEWARGGTETVGYDSGVDLFRKLVARDRAISEPAYTYLYLLTVDKFSHQDGIGSDRVTEEIVAIDTLLSRLREALPSRVRMIVTADHGLVDVEDGLHFAINDDDALCRHLVTGPTAEGVAPVFHVVPGQIDDFRTAFDTHPASKHFTLFTTEQLARKELFGPVPFSEKAALHWGDLVGIATRVAVLNYIPPGGKPVVHRAVHGGLRPGEVRIPLFLA